METMASDFGVKDYSLFFLQICCCRMEGRTAGEDIEEPGAGQEDWRAVQIRLPAPAMLQDLRLIAHRPYRI